MQIRRYNRKRHFVRYKSGLWSPVKASYDATKKEYKGILKALKKVHSWLYSVKFILETDTNVLVVQLNGTASDLPGSLLIY